MKKLEYIAPTVEIIEADVTSSLLAGSNVDVADFNIDGTGGDKDPLDNTDIFTPGDGTDMQ